MTSRVGQRAAGAAALLTGVLGLGGCGRDSGTTPEGVKPTVKVVRPVVREVTDYAFFTGRTEAIESVDVQSRVTGYLDSIDFKPGSEVKAGQRLFKIDPRPYQAALDEAAGQVKLAEARQKLAIADYERALEVAKTPGAISQQDIDKYAAAKSETLAAVDAAKASCESARLNVEFTDILSPIDGLAGRNLLTVGNLVKQDQTLLTTVVSEDPMYAYFDVDEHTMLRIQRLILEGKIQASHAGGHVAVQMGLADEGDDYPHEGQIDFVNNRVDPSTGTLQIRGAFPNPAKGASALRMLSPGMFVRVRLPIGAAHSALLVPEAAIGTDQGRKYLLVVNAQGLVEYRPVMLGAQQPGGLQVVVPVKLARTDAGWSEADASTPAGGAIVDSIAPDDQVIVGGLQRVRPGTAVAVAPIEPAHVPAGPVAVHVNPPTP
ncbi:MAG: efflux RND transporter periplasmic adaptor subunit [Pirellulales bacterium]|nr:efflux RND transporter periplasmic adaptor subunit [Pirellulales bacterium]